MNLDGNFFICILADTIIYMHCGCHYYMRMTADTIVYVSYGCYCTLEGHCNKPYLKRGEVYTYSA